MVRAFQFWEINLLLFRFQQPFTFFPWANLDEEIFSCANLNEDQFLADVCVRWKIECGNIIELATWHGNDIKNSAGKKNLVLFASILLYIKKEILSIAFVSHFLGFLWRTRSAKALCSPYIQRKNPFFFFLLVPNNGYLLFSSPICISNCCWISRSLRFKQCMSRFRFF